MPKHSISKSYEFEAGHRCTGFNKCKEKTIHGHTWTVTLHFSSPRLDDKGVVVDTNKISKQVKPVVAELDHSFLICEDDPMHDDFIELCEAYGLKDAVISTPFNPTAEALPKYFLDEIEMNKFPNEVTLEWIEVSIASLKGTRSFDER